MFPGHYQNSCPLRNNRERQQMPRYKQSARDYHRRNMSGPQPRMRALQPSPLQSRVAALNHSGRLSVVYLGTAVAASHHKLPSYVSFNYDSVDWDYHCGDSNPKPRLTII